MKIKIYLFSMNPMQIIYYDGTFEGFLTVLQKFAFERYPIEGVNLKNRRIITFDGELFYNEIKTDKESAKKFYHSLRKFSSKEFFKKIYLFYLCDFANIEIPLIRILRIIDKENEIWKNLSNSDSVKLYNAERTFNREKHRWLGLLRFIELPERILFAKFEPKFNVLPMISSHFVKRLPNEKFIIFDSLRKLVFTYKNRKKDLFWADGFDLKVSSDVDSFVQLWRCYFVESAIPERFSYERQRNRLPLRFRKFMPEFLDKNNLV